MRKALLFVLLLFSCSAVFGFSLKEWRQSAYDQVKAEAEKSFSAMMGRPVTIESAGGILIGEIELRGVNFPGFGRAEKVILYYNPLKYAYTKGDIVSSLATIKLINGRFSIVRNEMGKIDLLTLFSGPQQKEAAPPPFVGRLVLENCRVNYLDKKGLTGTPTTFNAELTGIYGKVTLKKSGAISFSATGRSPAAVKINGKVNSTTGQYAINISARELPLASWGNYFFKPADFDILDGQTDLIFQIASAKTKSGPLAWTGKLAIKNGAIRYQNYELNNIDGDLFLANNSLSFVNMAGQLFTTPFTLNGRCYDFSRLLLDLTINLNDAELNGLARAVPQLNNSGLNGRGTAQISLSGPATNPSLKGNILVRNGMIYQQKLSGRATFSFLRGDLKIDSENAEFLGGGASANLLVKSLLRAPNLSLVVKFNRLNLNHLAQKAPGLEGLATGSLDLSGPVHNMSGKVSAGLTSATLFGQPIEKAEASFQVRNGDFEFDKLNVSSGDTFIASHGSIDKYLNFDLFAEAAGIKLSGQGAFGAMRARLDKFSGHVRWQLSPQFFVYPLRNIFASGEAVLSDGQVGDQLFARAHGKIVLENGALSVLDTYVKQGATTFEVSGKAGVGRLTDLTISSKKIELADLKILNYFLPEDFRPVSGNASVEVRLTGLLPETTNITSVETLL
ncbi:MAG: DUF748 domain-containing protein, partial [Candidatus Margulisbacteria bacterium]|nr:DUF748 domain-containing protein [Candidatus Margulisiibacteriota bacterium]